MIRKREKRVNLAFERFGYATDKPCDVCGKEGGNQSEPRFGYVVCEDHYKLSPLEVSQLKSKRPKMDKETRQEELISDFYEEINKEVKSRNVNLDAETMLEHVESLLRLQVFLITLLSRKQLDNSLNMFFIIHTSKKIEEIMDIRKSNKGHEHYVSILSLCMEEGFKHLTALLHAMKKSHQMELCVFKDEIRAIEDYFKSEWSSYTNTI
jgi:hypothetical protein